MKHRKIVIDDWGGMKIHLSAEPRTGGDIREEKASVDM